METCIQWNAGSSQPSATSALRGFTAGVVATSEVTFAPIKLSVHVSQKPPKNKKLPH